MARVSITDFLLELGFDGKAVEKGLNNLEKRLDRINSKNKKAEDSNRRRAIQSVKVAKAEERVSREKLKNTKAEGKQLSRNNTLHQGILNKLRAASRAQSVMNSNLASITARANNINRRFRNLQTSNNGWNRSLQRTNNLMHGTMAHLTGMFGMYMLIQKAQQTIAASYNSGKHIQKANTSLQAVSRLVETKTDGKYGDSNEVFASQSKFIEDMSKEMGVSLAQTTTAYSRFLASATTPMADGKMQLQDVEDVFRGVQQMGAIHKLSTEEMKFVNMAVTQMMQKGKIQSEELRRQLAEKMPAAYELMAKAAGKTTQEFDIMMRNGEAIAHELLPKFGRELLKNADIMAQGDMAAYSRSSVQGLENVIKAALEIKNAMFFEDWTKGLIDLGVATEGFIKSNKMLFDKGGAYAGNFSKLLAQDIEKLTKEADAANDKYYKGLTTDQKIAAEEKRIFDATKKFYDNLKSIILTIKELTGDLYKILKKALPIFKELISMLSSVVDYVAKVFGMDGKDLLTDILAWGIALKLFSKLPFVGLLMRLLAGSGRFLFNLVPTGLLAAGGKALIALLASFGLGKLIGDQIWEAIISKKWGMAFSDALGGLVNKLINNLILALPEGMADALGLDQKEAEERLRLGAAYDKISKPKLVAEVDNGGYLRNNMITQPLMLLADGVTKAIEDNIVIPSKLAYNNLVDMQTAAVVANPFIDYGLAKNAGVLLHKFEDVKVHVTGDNVTPEVAKHIGDSIMGNIKSDNNIELMMSKASGEN
jgi:tape measure domain-containing protein